MDSPSALRSSPVTPSAAWLCSSFGGSSRQESQRGIGEQHRNTRARKRRTKLRQLCARPGPNRKNKTSIIRFEARTAVGVEGGPSQSSLKSTQGKLLDVRQSICTSTVLWIIYLFFDPPGGWLTIQPKPITLPREHHVPMYGFLAGRDTGHRRSASITRKIVRTDSSYPRSRGRFVLDLPINLMRACLPVEAEKAVSGKKRPPEKKEGFLHTAYAGPLRAQTVPLRTARGTVARTIKTSIRTPNGPYTLRAGSTV